MDYLHPDHVILPKVTGLYHCVKTLAPDVTEIFDITVGYSGLTTATVPYDEYLVQNVFFRKVYPREIHIHVKKHDISLLPGVTVFFPKTTLNCGYRNSISDEDNMEAFGLWLREKFIEKGKRMDKFYQIGSFEEINADCNVIRPEPSIHDWVLISLTWVSMMILLPLYIKLFFWLFWFIAGHFGYF
jgi:hypothetical protein